ncbi:MAG: aminotransferase class I/II-fold pyridoxal phosphate-dependent enzyme [Saprospiraceae bacterium]|nr:aminotransferase class I/II-fold pyridoxal phosphate-dependent enzyme [Saprospiraceae bacterium]
MKVDPASRLGSVEEYYFSRKLQEIEQLREAGADIINLGIGSPDLSPPPQVITSLKESLGLPNVHRYQSYRGVPELRSAFANWYRRFYQVELKAETELLPLIGSKEGIMHISMAFLNPGDQVLVPNPGYPAYSAAAKLAGAVVRPYLLRPEYGWLPDIDQIEKEDLSAVKIMWINNPHMPTGAQAGPEIFQQLVSFAKRNNILLVNDNPYSFVLSKKPTSLMQTPDAKEVALELNSLSKSHHMAGWRVGMVCGSAEKINTILRFKSNMDSGQFLGIQKAAMAALDTDQSWHDQQNQIYLRRKGIAKKIFDTLNCKIENAQVGMFLWARIPQSWKNAYDLSDFILKEAEVFITPGGIFGDRGDKYLRISLCSPEEVLVEALGRIEAQKIEEA